MCANHCWVTGMHEESERTERALSDARPCAAGSAELLTERLHALPKENFSGTPGTSIATLVLRNSSPRAFQRYLTHLLTPRGSQFTVSWLVHPHP